MSLSQCLFLYVHFTSTATVYVADSSHIAAMKRPHKPTLLLLIFGLVACVSSQNCTQKNTTLYIQGFVPGENPVYSSPNIVPAAYVAVNEINCNQSLLPDYHIDLNFSDTKVSSLPLGLWQHKGSGIQKVCRPHPVSVLLMPVRLLVPGISSWHQVIAVS